MTRPQPGIFATGFRSHYALEYSFTDGATDAALRGALGEAVSAASSITDSLSVFSFGAAAWARLGNAADQPEGLRAFEEIRGTNSLYAPATGGDVFVWIQGSGPDVVYDAVMAVHEALAGVADIRLDQPGFEYHASMDLIGFEDGSANPKDEAALEAALVPEGRPGAGGAFAMSQKWVHDLPGFNALDIGEQEKIVGRTKVENIELEGDDMPADSHVSRTDVNVDGVAQKIFRRSFPFGNTSERGLYFQAFACNLQRFQIQLDRMYGVSGDGLHDRLADFSRAVTGAYWFSPSEEALARATG